MCHCWGLYTSEPFFGQWSLCRASDRFARSPALNWLASNRLIRVRAVQLSGRHMSALRLAALQVGFHSGFFRLAQLARRQQAAILMFHRFSGNDEGHVRGLPIRRFAEYMEYLARHYCVVPLSDLIEDLRRGVIRPYATAVTVDDGYHEVFSLAAPVLRRYGLPATFFVVSDFIDGRLWLWTDRFRFVFARAQQSQVAFRHRGRIHVLDIQNEEARLGTAERCIEYAKRVSVAEREELLEAVAEACRITIPVAPPREYRPMTWAQLRALAADGFEVGAHTRTHPILSRVGPWQLHDEIEGCKEEIERNLGFPIRHFAYPNGRREDYGSEAVEAVSRACYRAAVTTVAGINTPSTPPYELRRIASSAEDLAHFAQDVSGFELAKLRFRAAFGLDRMLVRRRPLAHQAPILGPEAIPPTRHPDQSGPDEHGAFH